MDAGGLGIRLLKRSRWEILADWTVFMAMGQGEVGGFTRYLGSRIGKNCWIGWVWVEREVKNTQALASATGYHFFRWEKVEQDNIMIQINDSPVEIQEYME